jgi:hypothetical protein
MKTNHIRETYRFEVWLPGAIVQWLDSRYPDDEPEIAIGKALRALQGRDRKAQERSIQVLTIADYPTAPKPPRPPKPEPTSEPVAQAKLEPLPEPEPPSLPITQINMLQKSRTGDPISWLHQFSQLSRRTTPEFTFETIANGFRCTVGMLGRSGTGDAATKKEAKRAAAIELLDRLQS